MKVSSIVVRSDTANNKKPDKKILEILAESLWPSKVQGFFTVRGFHRFFSKFRVFFQSSRFEKNLVLYWATNFQLLLLRSFLWCIEDAVNCTNISNIIFEFGFSLAHICVLRQSSLLLRLNRILTVYYSTAFGEARGLCQHIN